MSAEAMTPKDAGELVASNVVGIVPQVDAVPDSTAEWYDAIVVEAIEPSLGLSLIDLDVVDVDVPVEIKAAQLRLASSQRGRFFVRKRQHERLVDEGGVYLFAPYVPNGALPVRALAIATAEHVDALLAECQDGDTGDGWVDMGARRCEVGYRQLTWSNVLDPRIVEGLTATALADGGDDVDDRRVYLPPAASPWNLAHYHTKASCAARGFGGPVREVFLETAVKEGHSACGICANGVEFVEGGVKA